REHRAVRVFGHRVNRRFRQPISLTEAVQFTVVKPRRAAIATESNPHRAVASHLQHANWHVWDEIYRGESDAIQADQAHVHSQPQVSFRILRKCPHGPRRETLSFPPRGDCVVSKDVAEIARLKSVRYRHEEKDA